MGKQKVSNDLKEQFRTRYLAGESTLTLKREFPASEGLFWLTVSGLREARQIGLFERKEAALRLLTEAERGWVAGIIDGEGWIGLSNSTNGIQPRISVQSTTVVMQDELERLLGGQRYVKRRSGRERDLFGWMVWTIDAVRAILRMVESHLIVKGDVARVVLEFCERRRRGHSTRRLDKRDYSRAKQLNRRGRFTRGT